MLKALRRGGPLLLTLLAGSAQGGVLMQGFYWDVPSPAAGGQIKKWWWDRLATQATGWRQAGFTAVWLPPVTKGAAGGYSVGYDPYDDYDLGAKAQNFTRPTRYGNREQLQALCATLRANNLEIYADVVLNHRNGDDGQLNFRHPDAYGTWGRGRFGKTASDFAPARPQDREVPMEDSSFGRDLRYSDNTYLTNGMKANGDWLVRALDLQGLRLDYVKGVSSEFLRDYLSSGALTNTFVVGEFFDGDLGKVRSWVDNSMRRRASAFDFPLRFMLKDMCNSPASFDMRRLDHAGLAGVDPSKAVTWVENHDTDTHDPIVRNKALGYAYILTSEGYPTVFYRDYAVEAGSYGMKPIIDNLVWIHEKLAFGPTQERWKNDKIFVYERTGGDRLLVGLNNNVGNTSTITCQTGFPPNTRLQDYTGQAPDVWTDATSRVTITMPRAVDGRGYCAYSLPGKTGGFANPPGETTQEYAGASDLDIMPADPWSWVQVARVRATARTPIRTRFFWEGRDLGPTTSLVVTLHDATGRLIAGRAFGVGSAQGEEWIARPLTTGWYTYRIRTTNTPPTNVRPAYWLRTTYKSPQT